MELIVEDLKKLRDDDVFEQMFEQVNLLLEANNLEEISLPRQRRPPARLTGRAKAFVHGCQCHGLLQNHFLQCFRYHHYATARQIPPSKHGALQAT